MPQSPYVTAQYRDDPLGFLIELIRLDAHEKALRKLDSSLYLLIGLTAHRHLPQVEQVAITREIYHHLVGRDTPRDIRSAMDRLYGIIGQLRVQPYWFSWSLSDSELRSYYETNRDFANAIERLGLDFGVQALSVTGLAAGLVKLSQNGIGSTVTSGLRRSLNVNLAEQLAKESMRANLMRASGIGAAMVTVFASILHVQWSRSERQARRELMARGLLRLSEM